MDCSLTSIIQIFPSLAYCEVVHIMLSTSTSPRSLPCWELLGRHQATYIVHSALHGRQVRWWFCGCGHAASGISRVRPSNGLPVSG
jgi:hypothetical protein